MAHSYARDTHEPAPRPASAERVAAADRAAQGLVAYEDFVEEPLAYEPSPRQLYVVDRRSVGVGRRWISAGVSLAVLFVVLLTLQFVERWTVGMGGLLFGAVILAAAAMMVIVGVRSLRKDAIPLVWINGSRGVLRLREYASQRGFADSANISFDEVQEVLYSIRKAHMPGTPSRVGVEGAGVFLRLLDGTVWPIIPATLARDAAYTIAVHIAQRIQVGVKQVGRQWASSGAHARAGGDDGVDPRLRGEGDGRRGPLTYNRSGRLVRVGR